MKIHPLEELAALGTSCLSLAGAGGSLIPYIGYVMLKVQLKGRCDVLDVPFLITEADLSNPILGYNVIKKVADEDQEKREQGVVVSYDFFRNVSGGVGCQAMELIADPDNDHLSHAKVVKFGHVVKKNVL